MELIKTIRIGIIGCGRILPAHLHAHKALQEKGVPVRIAALCDQNLENALRFRRRGEGPPPLPPVGPPGDPLTVPHLYVDDFQGDHDVAVYDSVEKMLVRAPLDAVEVLTPVVSHHTLALAALRAGKHVLVEKPVAISVQAARQMVQTAASCGKVLGVAEGIRYFPHLRMTRWAIEEGYIGDVTLVTQLNLGGYWAPDKIVAQTGWRHHKLSAGAGVTLDMGVHWLHLLRYLCGDIQSVQSIVGTLERERVTRDGDGRIIDRVSSDVDDTFLALLRFDSGAIGNLGHSWAVHGAPLALGLTIYGRKGGIKGNTLVLDDGSRLDVAPLFEHKASTERKAAYFPLGLTDPAALETLEFLHAIWQGRPMETSGQDGLRDLACAYAMVESARLRREVQVAQVENGQIAEYEREINEHLGLPTDDAVTPTTERTL